MRGQPLSPREQEVFDRILDGMTPIEICAELCLASQTVLTHLTHIRWKLGAKTTPQAVAIWFREATY